MLHIGVSGWSFDEWKDGFYAGVPRAKWLGHYAHHFPTVEVNYTFRRTMASTTAEKWREAVGPDFRFSVKAHQRITHTHRLKDPGEHLPYFLASLEPLGPSLGPVLFQTPPHLPRDDDRLGAFLEALPGTFDPVFEFRNESWSAPGVSELLASHGAGLVVSETDDQPAPAVLAAPLLYVRLRREAYSDDDLRAWAERLVAADARETWVYVKHEDDSPRWAARLNELVDDGQ
ncbi:MAG: DUF72 domain-containing protein [Acidimicrobiia bacterium]|nr:DUF72 domain-containing protein [Acidimicrobiia bacterium]